MSNNKNNDPDKNKDLFVIVGLIVTVAVLIYNTYF